VIRTPQHFVHVHGTGRMNLGDLPCLEQSGGCGTEKSGFIKIGLHLNQVTWMILTQYPKKLFPGIYFRGETIVNWQGVDAEAPDRLQGCVQVDHGSTDEITTSPGEASARSQLWTSMSCGHVAG